MSQTLGFTWLIILERKKKKQHKITFFNVLAVIGSTLSEKHSHCFRVRGIAAVNDK